MDFQLIFESLHVITQVIIIIITVITIIIHIRFNYLTILSAPTVLTSLGILGTFFGVAMGLHDFNTEDVQGSVPTLIDGLKTAFWSSVAGIAAAMTIKVRQLLQVIVQKQPKQKGGATVDDIVTNLMEVKGALIGDSESTLLTQIKNMRVDNNDKLDNLKSSMEDFMKNMADSNSKALIKALEEVIRDFNTKINEQFGDNFKELNQAIAKVLEWQEIYKKQLEEMIKQQQSTVKNMEIATKSYESVVENTLAFKTTANELSTLILTMNSQKQELRLSIEELGKLIDSARKGLPDIEKQVLLLAEQIKSGVEENNKAMESAISSSAETISSLMTNTNQ